MIVKWPNRAPTYEEIKENAIVDGCMAAWYPQMGGYVGKCWVRMGCYNNLPPTVTPGMDVLVYHDGEFPIDPDVSRYGGLPNNPIELHHCGADQFVRFGQLCEEFLGQYVETED